MGPFRGGIGVLALGLRAPVVPISVTGTFELLPKGARRPGRGPVSVRFGPPVELPAGIEHEQATALIEDAVRSVTGEAAPTATAPAQPCPRCCAPDAASSTWVAWSGTREPQVKVTVRGLAGLACVAAALAVPAPAIAAPTAVRIRIGDHPGFVRVVVDVRGGRVSANGLELAGFTDVLATGRQGARRHRVCVRARLPSAARASRHHRPGHGPHHADRARPTPPFKLVALFVLRAPERSTSSTSTSPRRPSPAAVIRSDGCLRLTGFTVTRRRVVVAGRLLRPILENQFAVAVRDVHGGIRARRTVGGQPGRTWRVRLAYRVSRRQAGTIEAFDLSARDGRVDCLVQDRALLLP